MEDTPLEADDIHILEAALSTAFTPGHSRQPSASTSTVELGNPSETDVNSSPPSSAELSQEAPFQASDDSWKVRYEEQVQTWRTRSAEAREKAEKQRARWESLRAEEQMERLHRSLHSGPAPGDPSSSSETSTVGSKIPQPPISEESSIPNPHAKESSGDAGKSSLSQKWEDVGDSSTSSFPSMTFPETSNLPSPDRSQYPSLPAAPMTVSLAIFNPSLSTRARVSAFFSALAVNLLLPFINGVMLGFGEIFAKNVLIGWLGRQEPGSVATNIGIGRSRSRRSG